MKKALIIGIVLTCCVAVTSHQAKLKWYPKDDGGVYIKVDYPKEKVIPEGTRIVFESEDKDDGIVLQKITYSINDKPDGPPKYVHPWTTMQYNIPWSETLYVGDIVKAISEDGNNYHYGEVLKIDPGYVLVATANYHQVRVIRKNWKFIKYIQIGTIE